VRAAKAAGIHLKRTFERVATWALKDYLRLMHGKKIRKAQKPLKKLRRYLSKLLKELDPHLEKCPQPLLRDMVIGAKLLLQTKENKNKIYSCHEPQVSCIAKGMDQSHETRWKTRSMLSQRGCWRSNPCHPCSSCTQLPNHPQETEAFLRQNFWVDQKRGLARIGENRAVKTSRLIGDS
jgi:hypothetical protein